MLHKASCIMKRRHPGGITIKLISFNIKERTGGAIPTARRLFTDNGKDNPLFSSSLLFYLQKSIKRDN
jgi:hypothetical protein